jgi:anaerobic magnesium-protoporphyrin IX monomethyl ester cyclase
MADMKVLLVDAPYVRVYGPLKGVFSKHPCQGLMSISAVLKAQGHDVRVIDPETEGLNDAALAQIVREFRPGIVGISAMTSNILLAYDAVRLVKAVDRDTFTVIGGYHASALPERTLTECPELDAVCVGEGEHAMSELADGKGLPEVAGLVFRRGGEVIRNQPRPITEDIDSLPLPDFDCLPLEKYHPHLHKAREGKWTTIITSRGCPYRCYYCASRIVNLGRFRAHSVHRVMDMIYALKERGFTYLRIFDDEFTVDKKRVMDICDRLVGEKVGIIWDCNSRVNIVDRELLQRMKEAGCILVFYGCESGNQEVLDRICKQITVAQTVEAFRMTHEAGMEANGSWILGNVWDTKETVEDTIRLAKRLIPYSTQHYFNFALPSPGTRFWDIAVEQGRACYDWSKYTLQNEPIYVPPAMTRDELMALMAKAHREVFFSPRFILNRALNMRSLGELKANISGLYTLVGAVRSWGAVRR